MQQYDAVTRRKKLEATLACYYASKIILSVTRQTSGSRTSQRDNAHHNGGLAQPPFSNKPVKPSQSSIH